MAHVHAHIGKERYAVAIEARGHRLTADEPEALCGGDTGPAPFDLLLSSLGACTAITLQMYAERKQWPLEAVDIDLRYIKTVDEAHIERAITVTGALAPEQKARLAEIAEKTPVTLVLKPGIDIRTELH
ncbi:OsmC family protein [Phreatobacter sp. AB_2022a]|uniref:OsmC family protein n=1 Tax=Phreatobacter sp. AB_2022a TaxID=3003134 RepID=UPI002287050C|nr:OsmC family protein [Phreatobacter sp. AB_2022a]MCZ0732776.1 OsmC family protein [Phreatobacter sp. AB_2022a]